MHLSEREKTILRGILAKEMTRKEEREEFNRVAGRNMDREHFRRVVQRMGKEPEVVWDPEEILTAQGNQTRGGSTGIQSSKLRVIIPDSHGLYIDETAKRVFLEDLAILDPDQIVMLGDHVDVSGLFSSHPNNYVSELAYSYEDDCAAANTFFDQIQVAAPRASVRILSGNHEDHYARWCARTHRNEKDAQGQVELLAPEAKLRYKQRGFEHFETANTYHGLNTPGMFKWGKCFFTHGFSTAKHATATHVARVGACIVHGHCHRAQSYITKTVASDVVGGWCPGTLSMLQPLYRHNSPTEWSHGFGLQAYENSGAFLHINVPISGGRSFLRPLLSAIRPSRLFGKTG